MVRLSITEDTEGEGERSKSGNMSFSVEHLGFVMQSQSGWVKTNVEWKFEKRYEKNAERNSRNSLKTMDRITRYVRFGSTRIINLCKYVWDNCETKQNSRSEPSLSTGDLLVTSNCRTVEFFNNLIKSIRIITVSILFFWPEAIGDFVLVVRHADSGQRDREKQKKNELAIGLRRHCSSLLRCKRWQV